MPRELPLDTALCYEGEIIVAIHRHLCTGERHGNAAVVDNVAASAAEVAYGVPAERTIPTRRGSWPTLGGAGRDAAAVLACESVWWCAAQAAWTAACATRAHHLQSRG